MYETEKIPVTGVVTRRKLLEDICLLGQAVTFFKYECLHLSKADLSWAQGLLHLTLLFHFRGDRPHSWRNALKLKFKSVGATPEAYAWATFQDPVAVYVKFAVDWQTYASRRAYRQPSAMMYVGSTAVSVTLQEANRMSVLRKLEQGHEAQAELAIRYWRQNACFNSFTLIKVASCCS